MSYGFSKILEALFNVQHLQVSGVLVLIFAIIRYAYPKSKIVRAFIFELCNVVSANSKDNMGTDEYWWFFSYYFLVITLAGLLSSLSIGDIFSNEITAFLFVLPALVFCIYQSCQHKGLRAITDISEPGLPLIARILFFPIEFIMLVIKAFVLPLRLAIHAYISHRIVHSLLSEINDADYQFIVIANILIFIKLLEIMSSVIQAMVFTINCSMWFGKLYSKDHE